MPQTRESSSPVWQSPTYRSAGCRAQQVDALSVSHDLGPGDGGGPAVHLVSAGRRASKCQAKVRSSSASKGWGNDELLAGVWRLAVRCLWACDLRCRRAASSQASRLVSSRVLRWRCVACGQVLFRCCCCCWPSVVMRVRASLVCTEGGRQGGGPLSALPLPSIHACCLLTTAGERGPSSSVRCNSNYHIITIIITRECGRTSTRRLIGLPARGGDNNGR